MKINDFSRGLNTRLDATLIDVAEAIVYTNIDNSKTILKSAKNYTATLVLSDNWVYNFKNIWYSSNTERDYVEYLNKLYYTEYGSQPSKIVNGSIKYLGLPKPDSTLVAVDGGAGSISTSTSTLQYTYTYYDSSEGVESEPANLSAELSLDANKQVSISNFIPPNVLGSAADLIRLYRLGAGATEFTLIAELPINTSTYIDNIPTANSLAVILDTLDNQMPTPYLRYLVEAYGILFAANGSRLYYTLVGKPDAWPTDSFIDVYNDITGVFPIQDGILIYTDTSHHLLIGTDESTFRIIKLNNEEGCNSHKSCKIVKNTPIWSSNNGICAYQGGGVEILTKDKLDKVTFNILNTAVYNEQYFILLADNTLLAIDFSFDKMCIKEYSFGNITDIGVYNGVLYAAINGYICTMFTGDDMTLCYTSPEFTEGDTTVTKMYNNIYMYVNGEFVIQTYIDKNLVSNENVNATGIVELKVPQEKQRGSSIQFKIEGKGEIKEIEYKVIGRQNGR